jgi:integrase
VAARTRNRYAREYAAFSLFCRQHGIVLVTLDSFDVAAAGYVEFLWEEGEPKNRSQDLLASLQYYLPVLRRNLALSWALLAAWNRHEMPTRAMPMTPEILAAFCGGLLHAGQPRLALLCVFGFSVLARTGELLSLERRHIVLGEQSAVISFEMTKRGQRLGVDEGVCVDDPVTLHCLRVLCSDLAPGDRLLQLSEHRLRAIWHHVAGCLQLTDFACRPYSLRRGGATHLYRRTGNLHIVMQIGRWTSMTTARRYVSDATAALTTIRLSEPMQREFLGLASEFRRFLHSTK